MKKFILALFCTLWFVSSSFSEVIILPKYHIRNEPPGYCMWCALETVGRHLGIEALYNLKERRKLDGDLIVNGQWMPKNVGDEIPVILKLQDLKVQYQLKWGGVRDEKFLRDNIKFDKPVCIGVMLPQGYHAVVLTEINDSFVRFIDSNSPGLVQEWTKELFDSRWTGYAVAVSK